MRTAGFGLVLALAGCVQPPPVIHVTIVNPAPPAAAPAPVVTAQPAVFSDEPMLPSPGQPVTANWGYPLPMRGNDGEVWQLEVCRTRVESAYRGCFPYGPSSPDSKVCAQSYAKAEIDFPGENYPCAWVKRSDIDNPPGLNWK